MTLFLFLNRLTEGQLVAMSTDAASGLAYLERVGYVHKDVAARNCIVTQDLSVKITGKYNNKYVHFSLQTLPPVTT